MHPARARIKLISIADQMSVSEGFSLHSYMFSTYRVPGQIEAVCTETT